MSLSPQIPDPLTPRMLAELAAGSDWLVSWWPAAVGGVIAPELASGFAPNTTECLNCARGGSQLETYLTAVVVPWVDQNYATLPDWPHRVIGGMSSGGFCALEHPLLHQELFGTIIALEPYGDPGAGGRAMLATAAEFKAHSPSSYLPTLTFAHPVQTFFDVGG
ncbi:MAG: hypothetical protein H7269_07830, partial [Cellulomonas sp.]|nr:hypothetical protein [Cellulomonas sp.]